VRRLALLLVSLVACGSGEAVYPTVIVPLSPAQAPPASTSARPSPTFNVEPPAQPAVNDPAVGDDVQVEWNGTWYPATILERRDAQAWFIHYTGYDASWDEVVGPDRLRPSAP
jgi:RNA binding activity-knot of a chromodomain